jgi:hypothetical protein
VDSHGGTVNSLESLAKLTSRTFISKWVHPVNGHSKVYISRLHYVKACRKKTSSWQSQLNVMHHLGHWASTKFHWCESTTCQTKPPTLWLLWCHTINFAWAGLLYICCNQSPNGKWHNILLATLDFPTILYLGFWQYGQISSFAGIPPKQCTTLLTNINHIVNQTQFLQHVRGFILKVKQNVRTR